MNVSTVVFHSPLVELINKMDEIRTELIAALRGGQAYDTIEQILSEVPVARRYFVPNGLEHSAWQILEHMRFALEDLYAFSTNFEGSYREPSWPEDYWPKSAGEQGDWEKSLAGLQQAQSRMEKLATEGDLIKPFPWEESHNLLREVILAIEHAAYHSGELVELTRHLANPC